MPVNIAPSVTPVYTATVNVPLDGEYANSAALQSTALALANRTEYVRQLVESAPWKTYRIVEDFCADQYTPNVDAYFYDERWHTSGVGLDANITLGSASTAANAIGVQRFSNVSGSAVEARFRKSFSLAKYAQFRRFVARLRTGSIVAGNTFEAGAIRSTDATPLDTGAPRDVMSWTFNPSASPNWRVRTDDGAAQTFTDSGIAVVADTDYVLDLRHDGAGGLTMFIGGVACGVPVANVPSMALDTTAQWKFAMPAAGANRRWDFDLLFWEFTDTARVL